MENISHSEITIHAWIRHVLWDLKEQRKSRIFHGIMSDMSSKKKYETEKCHERFEHFVLESRTMWRLDNTSSL